ncbi:50S ribosomal protein L37e [Methanocella arvoryzae]|uniref:50S ribosomal protein L37e n=1 Tax=Methanocella arvoryzae TaxID=1175445 RepID=UPI0003249584|nr:50S ribosomal protein L37e [Methanocella arvoryzae]
MSKGTPSQGKRSKRVHSICRRCGKVSFNFSKSVCASCGFGRSAKLNKWSWHSHLTRKTW